MESADQKPENESSNKTKKNANGGAAQKKAVDSPKYAWEMADARKNVVGSDRVRIDDVECAVDARNFERNGS